MKLRYLLLTVFAFLLAACNFSLAADVTPPPGYVPPTPLPTLGALYPAQPMDTYAGAKVYFEKCAPCHGMTGLGDGEKGKELPVRVAPIGLAELAQKATPASWYERVSRGNIDRYMPPFYSLNEQERWNVVGFAIFLHLDPIQLDQGQRLFEANCPDCQKYFTDLKTMAALSELDLIAIAKNGKGEIPAFGKNLSAEELAAVAVYLRSLTLADLAHGAGGAPKATVAPATPAADSTAAIDTTPAAVSTPAEGTPAASVEPTAATTTLIGKVSGKVDNQTGAALPADAKIVLVGYEHGGDPNAGPDEVFQAETSVNADGSFLFENVELPERRIFLAEAQVNGLTYRSEFALVEAGMTEVSVPPIVVYAVTEDVSVLRVLSLQLFFDFANENDLQLFAVYSIMNEGDKTLRVKIKPEQNIPFIAFPKGAAEPGYDVTQNSAQFTALDDGFAMAPSATPYGLIAFGSLPKTDEILVSQPALADIEAATLFLPEGVTASGAGLTDMGIQTLEDMQGMKFHVYEAGKVKKDSTLEFTLTGAPAAPTAVNPDVTQNKNLLVGVGAFGLVLVLIGVWLFIRDRNKTKQDEDEEEEDDGDEDEEDEDDNMDAVMDAIIALDDQRRAGKISEEAYKSRRDELKKKLKK